ncbi:MAG: aminotransferase class V-fold PLP-dependent enzyme [Candidatus Micrarchaeia archaeon]
MDVKKIKSDFPIFQKRQGLVYFDSACTTLKPRQVIEAQNSYYEEYSGCAGRSAHSIAKKTSDAFEAARERVARFVNSKGESVVWTKNTSEGLNLVVRSLDYSKRKKIVTTRLEHHSLLLPIMEQKRRGIAGMGLIETGPDALVTEEAASKAIDRETALVAIHHTTNTTGMRAPVEKIIKIAHDNGALVLIDGAQGIPHSRFDFSKSGADFLAFSGHKMLGPTGIGCLVGRQEALEGLDTFMVGGETIDTVTMESVAFKKAPKKFEAGIQNYAGAIGLGAACDYLSKIGMANIEEHEKKLAAELVKAIQSIPGSSICGSPDAAKRCGLASFNLKGVSAHQTALMCDSLAKIALRSGVFCAQPAMESMGAGKGAVRASLYIYNDMDDIKALRETLEKIAKLGN